MWSDNFTVAFFVSFIINVFVPNSVVATHFCPPQNAYMGPPMVKSKKYFDITAHPELSEAKWPSQQAILIFCFVYYTIFLVPLANTISTEPSPKSLQCPLEYVCLKKVMDPKIKI